MSKKRPFRFDKEFNEISTKQYNYKPLYDNFVIGYNIYDSKYSYRVVKVLGKGTYGTVYKCVNAQNAKHVAIKVIKNLQKYRESARNELEALYTLDSNDPLHENCCIHCKLWFEHLGHICIVFDVYGESLKSVLRFNKQPFSTDQSKKYIWQTLLAVEYIHSLGFIHTDINLDNILFERRVKKQDNYYIPCSNRVKVIDFGCALLNSDKHPKTIGTAAYRAPEIYLGKEFSFEIDMWSVGCILYECVTGSELFPYKHPFRQALKNSERSKEVKRLYNYYTTFSELDPLLASLLKGLLSLDSSKRLTATQAKEHAWFY